MTLVIFCWVILHTLLHLKQMERGLLINTDAKKNGEKYKIENLFKLQNFQRRKTVTQWHQFSVVSNWTSCYWKYTVWSSLKSMRKVEERFLPSSRHLSYLTSNSPLTWRTLCLGTVGEFLPSRELYGQLIYDHGTKNI